LRARRPIRSGTTWNVNRQPSTGTGAGRSPACSSRRSRPRSRGARLSTSRPSSAVRGKHDVLLDGSATRPTYHPVISRHDRSLDTEGNESRRRPTSAASSIATPAVRPQHQRHVYERPDHSCSRSRLGDDARVRVACLQHSTEHPGKLRCSRCGRRGRTAFVVVNGLSRPHLGRVVSSRLVVPQSRVRATPSREGSTANRGRHRDSSRVRTSAARGQSHSELRTKPIAQSSTYSHRPVLAMALRLACLKYTPAYSSTFRVYQTVRFATDLTERRQNTTGARGSTMRDESAAQAGVRARPIP